MDVSLNYSSQNGGKLYRAPYNNRNLNIGPRIDSNLGQSPYDCIYIPNLNTCISIITCSYSGKPRKPRRARASVYNYNIPKAIFYLLKGGL